MKGVAKVTVPAGCTTPESCKTRFQLTFGDLDAATVQTAILGAHVKGTLLSDLINRLRPTSTPVWPELDGTVIADSLLLDPVTLKEVRVEFRLQPTGAEITSIDGKLLGGAVHGAGTLTTGEKPTYTFAADFEKLNPSDVGQLLGENWRSGSFDAQGKLELKGYTGRDLADSANGTLHFEWKHGVAASGAGEVRSSAAAPGAFRSLDRGRADRERQNRSGPE